MNRLRNFVLFSMVMVLFSGLFIIPSNAVAGCVGIGSINISDTKCPQLSNSNNSKYLTTTITNNCGEDKMNVWIVVEIKTKSSNNQWLQYAVTSFPKLQAGETKPVCTGFDVAQDTTTTKVVVREGSSNASAPELGSKSKVIDVTVLSSGPGDRLKKNLPAVNPNIKKIPKTN